MDPEQFTRGIALFNRQEFFAAHEVLEDVWRPATGPQRQALQGLIQFAVALHHFTHGNAAGARSILKRAVRNLGTAHADCESVDLDRARAQAEAWLAHVEQGGPQPPFPRL